ncbi:MAG: DUF2914 domain-containing protein [Proteobacteria bacterium]|nr:DUF2914 domain-containing protein [Pseudomonadota bacterium]
MDRKSIEEKDQLLIKKFRHIIHSKEKTTAAKKPVWKTTPVWLVVFCVGIIVTGWLVFKEGSTVPYQSTDAVIEDTSDKNTELTISPEKTTVKNPENPSSRVPEQPIQPKNTGLSEAHVNPVPPTPEAVETQADKKNLPPGILISEMVVCSRVEKRQYVLPKTIFSMGEGISPVVWMVVMADHPPLTLTHVYYVNGQEYCKVPLKIAYPRTRTWSHVTLNLKKHLGAWRVDVMTDTGETLDSVEFSVVP